MKTALSVAIATYNEEDNLGGCLASVATLADEIVVVDGGSTDRTVARATQFKAKVITADNPAIFHINKQKALEACSGVWILQLDADERVSEALASEIRFVIAATDSQIDSRTVDTHKQQLFLRHQQLLEKRDGKIGESDGAIAAFYIARRNYFLGHPMTYGGMYPDGVIRLIKKGLAWFPAKSVHEQIHVQGRVSWLYADLIHLSNPTLARYLRGADGYTNLLAEELETQRVHQNPFGVFIYMAILPIQTFMRLFFRHKGMLDGFYGFLFALFSATHYPVAYIKLWKRVVAQRKH